MHLLFTFWLAIMPKWPVFFVLKCIVLSLEAFFGFALYISESERSVQTSHKFEMREHMTKSYVSYTFHDSGSLIPSLFPGGHAGSMLQAGNKTTIVVNGRYRGACHESCGRAIYFSQAKVHAGFLRK